MAGPKQPDDTIYMIARGVESVPITIGGWTLSASQMATARLKLQVMDIDWLRETPAFFCTACLVIRLSCPTLLPDCERHVRPA